MAPPRPWTTRAATKAGSEPDRPHRIDPATNTTMAPRKIGRAPNRSAAQPLAGMKTARLRR